MVRIGPQSAFYIPDPLSTESVLWFARVVHNVCETLEVNFRARVNGGGNGLVERTVYTVHGITIKDLQGFRVLSSLPELRGQIFADDIDNWLSERGQGRMRRQY